MPSNKFREIQIGDIIEGIDGPVNRQAIIRYAKVSGDQNPIHTTYEVAMTAGLKGVIQHGLFSMGWLIKTLINWINHNGKLDKIQVQFRAMVRPNDLVHSKGEITRKFEENGEKFVELKLIQEAWSLLCKGLARTSDEPIDPNKIREILLNAKLGMEVAAEFKQGEINLIEKEKFELQADKLEIIPNSLSFWEAFTRGWLRPGEKIQVELNMNPPSHEGTFSFSLYRVSTSILGMALISIFS
ncbi:MAG: MaoC/PaaZ C-terminal domain-containing protein [Candidatus Helarchaeota archaeon]